MYTYIFHYFVKAFQGTIILTIPLMTLALVVVSVLRILSTIAAFTILLQGSVKLHCIKNNNIIIYNHQEPDRMIICLIQGKYINF